MHVVTMSAEKLPVGEQYEQDHERLLRELAELEGQVKYQTYYVGLPDGPGITLVTTSQQLHLMIGQLSYKSQRALAEAIFYVLHDEDCEPKYSTARFEISASAETSLSMDVERSTGQNPDGHSMVFLHLSPTQS